MDFSTYNSCANAEAGAPMEIKDPYTGEVIKKDGEAARVFVRGVASKTMQDIMREKQKAAMMAEKSENEVRVMDDIHNQLCEAAAPFVVGFENVDFEGKALTGSPKDVMTFLKLTFPDMGQKLDDQGNPIFEDGFDEDGKPTKTPAMEMKNNPFAKQVSDFASRQQNFMGNAKSG